MPNIGTSVGGYQLLDLLHTGRNSQIFQATREGGGQQVALKFLLPERRKDRKAVKTHVQEFQMAKSLEHPLLVRMLQYERNRNKKSADFGHGPYYVMDFFKSTSLKIAINKDQEKIKRQAHRIVTQLAQALAFMDGKNIVHRDFNPTNILVNSTGEIRVSDFGVAMKCTKGLFGSSKPKDLVGTRSYMAPEQIRKQRLDGRTDIYALGCTIYEMLTGKPPIRAENPDELLLKHCRSTPLTLTQRGMEDVTPEMDALALTMLAKKKEDRPDNMHSFLAQFRKMRISTDDPMPSNEGMANMGM